MVLFGLQDSPEDTQLEDGSVWSSPLRSAQPSVPSLAAQALPLYIRRHWPAEERPIAAVLRSGIADAEQLTRPSRRHGGETEFCASCKGGQHPGHRR
ncbi:unnamed protein product [Lota lota]